MRRFLLLLMTVGLAGCGSAPRLTGPSARAVFSGPLRLGLAGQSNAMLLRPFLAEVSDVRSFYGEVTTIAPCWSVHGTCWTALRPTLAEPLDAFVWWQGESDVLAGTTNYAPAFEDLVRRVRSENRKPALLVVVMQLGPFADNGRGGDVGKLIQQQRREWVARDGHAIYVVTQDLEYRVDDVHMTDRGYRDVSARIVETVKQGAT